jgi:hypothetical protein
MIELNQVKARLGSDFLFIDLEDTSWLRKIGKASPITKRPEKQCQESQQPSSQSLSRQQVSAAER